MSCRWRWPCGLLQRLLLLLPIRACCSSRDRCRCPRWCCGRAAWLKRLGWWLPLSGADLLLCLLCLLCRLWLWLWLHRLWLHLLLHCLHLQLLLRRRHCLHLLLLHLLLHCLHLLLLLLHLPLPCLHLTLLLLLLLDRRLLYQLHLRQARCTWLPCAAARRCLFTSSHLAIAGQVVSPAILQALSSRLLTRGALLRQTCLRRGGERIRSGYSGCHSCSSSLFLHGSGSSAPAPACRRGTARS
jgi:hypothetical protein